MIRSPLLGCAPTRAGRNETAMTIDNSNDAVITGEWTIEGLAYGALAQAHSDILKACEQLRVKHNIEEAKAIAAEARALLETVDRLLAPAAPTRLAM